MINRVGQIMLYVNDQDESMKFWTEKVGFNIVSEEDNGQGFRWIEISPTKESETSIILHNKKLISEMQPELNLNTPSLMFFTENIDRLYKNFSDKNIILGDLVNMPSGRVFNFSDNEGNYFAIMEKS